MSVPPLIKRIYNFYAEGFRSMTVGRKLWLIILVKLAVIFAVLRLFFFTPALSGSDEQKAEAVRKALTGAADKHTGINLFNIQP